MSEPREHSENVPAPVRKALGDQWVTFHNDLTRSIHNLTLGEKRIIAACIAQVKSDSPIPAVEERARKTFTVTVAQYCELYEVARETAYEQMKHHQALLWKREIRTIKPDGKEGRKVRWVQEIQYNERQSSVTLMWSDAVCSVLYNLKKEFTTYKLKYAAQFTSKYTWDLFDMLAMWRRAGKFTIDVDLFRDKLDVKPSQRANYKELRTRVIEPSLDEIKKKCGLVVSVEERKKGRRVSELHFTWEPDPQGELQF